MRQIILKSKIAKRNRLHRRIRARIFSGVEIPRLAIFRSNKFIYAQIIDDSKAMTLVSASDLSAQGGKTKENKIVSAKNVGKILAEKAIQAKIKKVVFDRGGFAYKGRVAALAEGAREGGLEF